MHKNESSSNIAPHSAQQTACVPVAVVGARGYSGLELSRILLKHPRAKLVAALATDAGFKLSDYLPEAAAQTVTSGSVKDLDSLLSRVKCVFLATPAEASMELAPKILAAGVDVIDLSGAFRLKEGDSQSRLARYSTWYGFEHSQLGLLDQAEYGLSPWNGPIKSSQGARLVANPGCYATAVLMAVLPLLKEGLVQPGSIVIDAKSGTSGAGRKAAENLLYTEVEGECLPYKVGKHQHLPEICEAIENFAGVQCEPMFSTSLLPVRRGIIAGIYARLAPGRGTQEIAQAFERAYQGYELVKLTSLEGLPASAQARSMSLKLVAGSARTQISFQVDGDRLYVFSLIDNLVKGAAGQAVENFNRLQDFPVSLALADREGIL